MIPGGQRPRPPGNTLDAGRSVGAPPIVRWLDASGCERGRSQGAGHPAHNHHIGFVLGNESRIGRMSAVECRIRNGCRVSAYAVRPSRSTFGGWIRQPRQQPIERPTVHNPLSGDSGKTRMCERDLGIRELRSGVRIAVQREDAPRFEGA